MKVKDFLKLFKLEDLDKELIFSSDEELNTLRSRCGIDTFTHDKNLLVLYGYDGSEIEDVENYKGDLK